LVTIAEHRRVSEDGLLAECTASSVLITNRGPRQSETALLVKHLYIVDKVSTLEGGPLGLKVDLLSKPRIVPGFQIVGSALADAIQNAGHAYVEEAWDLSQEPPKRPEPRPMRVIFLLPGADHRRPMLLPREAVGILQAPQRHDALVCHR
jgi:hypothetical protein